MFDGFGNAVTGTYVKQPPIGMSLNEAPGGITFSTGGRSYQSCPKDSGTSVTTISVITKRCGPWIKIVFGNQEATEGMVTVKGEI